MVYLDNNSTTSLYDEVISVINELSSKKIPLNPSSIHSSGRYARSIVENSRELIASSLNFSLGKTDYRIIFTSSGTEANNLLINNFKDDLIFISPIEHKSIHQYKFEFNNVDFLQIDNDGIIDLEYLDKILSENSKKSSQKILVSVMSANNETGIIQPIQNIADICRKYNSYFHTDAIQAIGKIDFNFEKIKPDFVTISAHKIGGPVGTAALIAHEKYHLKPHIIGGGQERGARSGTENVISIAAFAKAVEISIKNLDNFYNKTIQLRDYLENKILSISDDSKIIGKNVSRLPNTSMIYMPNTSSTSQLIQFDLLNICVSSGSACSSGKTANSYVLEAMKFPKDIVSSSIRVSIGNFTNIEDIKKFINIWEKIYLKNNIKGIKHAS